MFIKVPTALRTLRKYENKQTNKYCYYSDNLEDLKISKKELEHPEITILTTHGGAFDYKEFGKLEHCFGERLCRWINFSFPGYDNFEN